MKAKDQLVLESLYDGILVEQQFLTEGLTDGVASWIWSLVEKKFPQLAQATEKALRELIKTQNLEQATSIIAQAFQQAPTTTNEGIKTSLGAGLRACLNAATPYLQSVQGLASSIKDLPNLLDPQSFVDAIMHLVPDVMEALTTFMHSIGSGNIEDINDFVTEPGKTILKKVGFAVALALLAYGTKKYMEMKKKKKQAPADLA